MRKVNIGGLRDNQFVISGQHADGVCRFIIQFYPEHDDEAPTLTIPMPDKFVIYDDNGPHELTYLNINLTSRYAAELRAGVEGKLAYIQASLYLKSKSDFVTLTYEN